MTTAASTNTAKDFSIARYDIFICAASVTPVSLSLPRVLSPILPHRARPLRAAGGPLSAPPARLLVMDQQRDV
jgi:hypothetical protein